MMKILNKPLFCILTLVTLLLTGSFSSATDMENWTFIGGKTKIKNTLLSFHNANFFKEEGRHFLNYTQVSLDFPSKRDFSLGIGYKQEYVEFVSAWRAEYRPMLHLYYRKRWGNLSFRDRSRWEFRFIEGELINRYRNQLQLLFTKFKGITPYLSTELSFYVKGLDYTRQRTILGAAIPVKSMNLNLFLGHQINEDIPEMWNDKILLGTGVTYNF